MNEPQAITDFSQALADFSAAQERTKVELASVNDQIGRLEQRRGSVERAAPHTDDIIDSFVRGVREVAGRFNRQLETYLAGTFGPNDGAGAKAIAGTSNVLTMEAQRASEEERLTRAMRGDAPTLNIAALTYFMRDRIEAEMPGLVDRLYPAARNGMRKADRVAELRQIDGELGELRAKRTELDEQLTAAARLTWRG